MTDDRINQIKKSLDRACGSNFQKDNIRYLLTLLDEREKELSRLREALEKIAKLTCDLVDAGTSCAVEIECKDIAKEALSPKAQCEHDHGDYGWQNSRKINNHFTYVSKKDEATCPFCPASSGPKCGPMCVTRHEPGCKNEASTEGPKESGNG